MSYKLSVKQKIKLYYLIHTEKIWRRYYYENTMGSTGLILFLKEEAKWLKDILYGAWMMTFSKRYAYPYYEGKKKSKLRIYLDNMWWAIRYREVNKFYYVYGFDNKDSKMEDYVAYSEFRVLRNILNIRQHENKKNTKYCFNYLCIPRDKFIFGQFCESFGVPYPKTYGLAFRGKIWWIGFNRDGYEEISNSSLPDIDAFCKEIAGGGGRKAFFLLIKNGVTFIDDKKSDASELKTLFMGERYIIQERMVQHPVINQIYPHSINTIRLMTIMDEEGDVSVLFSKMRFGAGGNRVDNCGQGGLSVGINHTTGKLMDIAIYNPGFGSVVHENHPDTGVKFADVQIPFYHEAVEESLKLHTALYGVRSMGWDIVITSTGPVFIEAGEDWELSGSQLLYGGLREHYYLTHGSALEMKQRKV